ncbi:hypothetical protein [Streptomyces sp. NBC_00356]|uniref:hypothetical protein n=1 Tax=Streptomyces sp. NBC_00356 TaxID=2975724 RepID=UPI002E253146
MLVSETGFTVSEDRREDFSDADIDRRFAAIVQGVAADMEPGGAFDRDQPAVTAGAGKPMWYLVPLRMVCSITFFMTLCSCLAAYGCVMNEARWGTATLISFCVSVGSGVCRRVAKARYDRRHR